MTEITKYKCDICGATYKDKAECEKCESSHNAPLSVKNPIYNSSTGITQYPIFVDVVFYDGSTVEYAYNHLISTPDKEEEEQNE